MPRRRGAIPSPRHQLAAATPHRILGPTPSQVLYKPSRLSMWLNDVYGDCVTAEEAFAKACYTPEIFILDEVVHDWAKEHYALNGAYLTSVMDQMRGNGFHQSHNVYRDGPNTSVDWTDAAILQNAISYGPVKIGVAADQLENAVPDPPQNGWFATGFQPESPANEDHCVSLCGYGEIGWLANQLGVGSPVPGNTPGYALFTWSSIGIIDVPSMLAITFEAWLRNPVTVIHANPD